MPKISKVIHIHDHGIKIKEVELYGKSFRFISDVFCKYKFAAINKEGLLYLYEVKPVQLLGDRWSNGLPFKSLLLAQVEVDIDWKDSVVDIDVIWDLELN